MNEIKMKKKWDENEIKKENEKEKTLFQQFILKLIRNRKSHFDTVFDFFGIL